VILLDIKIPGVYNTTINNSEAGTRFTVPETVERGVGRIIAVHTGAFHRPPFSSELMYKLDIKKTGMNMYIKKLA
jgi:hypothetical protein